MMGIDHGELKEMLKRHIHTFISDISPTVRRYGTQVFVI